MADSEGNSAEKSAARIARQVQARRGCDLLGRQESGCCPAHSGSRWLQVVVCGRRVPFTNKPIALQRNSDVESPTRVEPNAAGGIEWNTTQLFGAAYEVGIRH